MTIVEDFESDLSKWIINNSPAIVNGTLYDPAYEGSSCLELSSYAGVFSNDPSLSFQPGQTLRVAIYSNDSTLDDDEIVFGYSGTDTQNSFAVQMGGRYNSYDPRIVKYVDGSEIVLASQNGFGATDYEWEAVEVEWGTDGTITYRYIDFNGTPIHVLSANDTTFSGSNIALRHGVDASRTYYDALEITGGTPQPISATLESASLLTSAQSLSATGGAEPAPTSDVTRGLVSKWTLDGDGLDAVGTNDPSTVSGVTYTSGYIDQAGSFSSSDFIEYPHDSSLQSVDFTISAWANVNSTSSGTQNIQTVSAKNLDHTDRQFWLVEWDGSWTCRIGSNGQGVTGPAATPGAWTHLLATYDSATSTFEFWVNGISQGTATESTIGGDGQTFCIGAESASYRMFGGLIDEVRYYNVVLTDSEIADLYAYDGTASLVTASLEMASLAFSPRALGATPGATGATLGAATANLAAPNVGTSIAEVFAGIESAALTSSTFSVSATAGPTSATLGAVGVTAAPISPSTLCGPVTAGIDVAGITAEAGEVGTTLGVVSPILASASVSSTPAPFGSIVGPTSADLDSSSLIALSRPLGVSEAVYAALESAAIVSSPGALGASPGAVSASMPSAALSVVAESPLVALAELAVELDAGSLAVSVRKVTPVAGPVSVALESASVVLTLPDVEALKALVAALDAASITSVASDVGAIPGSLSPELDAASAVISSSPVDVGLGLRSVGLDVADLVALIPEISAENVLYLFLRVSEAGNSGFTLDGTGSTGFSVGNSGDNGFELDSDNENSL